MTGHRHVPPVTQWKLPVILFISRNSLVVHSTPSCRARARGTLAGATSFHKLGPGHVQKGAFVHNDGHFAPVCQMGCRIHRYTWSTCKHGDSVLHAARSDHLAPVGRRHNSFIKIGRHVAGDITCGTDVRKQEVLDRFFRVQGNNAEDYWNDKGQPHQKGSP